MSVSKIINVFLKIVIVFFYPELKVLKVKRFVLYRDIKNRTVPILRIRYSCITDVVWKFVFFLLIIDCKSIVR